MKRIILILTFLFSFNVVAEDKVDVKIEPSQPVAGENFTLMFEITTKHNGQPYISFDPGSLNVMGREERGVSISTTVVNGRFSTKRVVKYAYELIAPRAGRFYIRNVQVELGDKTVKSKSFSINVVKTAPKSKDVFVLADVSKTDVFIGEGIDVRYYLYYKIPVGGTEIKEFPKLNKFIKRFHMTNERVETVEYGGEIYKRVIKYSAKVFPEKLGKAYIDPLKLRIQYSSGYRNSPYGSFGLQLRQYRTKTIQSPRVEINIKALPVENVPDSFTGLIGKHEFGVSVNRNKHLVNEPVELKLHVKGEGALENMDAPILFTHPELEKFDTKTELAELDKQVARKTFEYTYLARNQLQIEPYKKELSYFDPEKLTFETVTVNIPGITVGGSSASNQGVHVNGGAGELDPPKNKSIVQVPRGIVAPLFRVPVEEKLGGFPTILNGTLLFIIVLIMGLFMKESFAAGRGDGGFDAVCRSIKRKGITYSSIFDLMEKLREVVPNGEKRTLSEIVAAVEIDEDGKKYFKYIVEETEKLSFDDDSRRSDLGYDEKYFKALRRFYDKQRKNADSRSEEFDF